MRHSKFLSLLFTLFTSSAAVAATSASDSADLDVLLNLDLRQLMDVKVSIASRTEESQFNSAAAVYVLTAEDIRRSGLRRIPEILRLIPGVQVGKQDANKWAVSIRNSQTRFSSTLLVMIDGLHVYTSFFAGVYWDSVDTFIEDIDRIEVVRGPGGALWGANAIDGIINIITKRSTDTQGALAYALAGTGEMKRDAGLRYGGRTENGINFRVYAKGFETDTGEYLDANESNNNGLAPVGEDSNDDGDSTHAGLRMDWESGQDSFSLQGSFHRGDFNEDRLVSGTRIPNKIMSDGYNGIFKWRRRYSDTEVLSINTFYNQITSDNSVLDNDEATVEVDMQHDFRHNSHLLSWGLGYRNYRNEAIIIDLASCAVNPCFSVNPPKRTLETFSAFAQDKISLSDKFTLIVGSKFERNDYTGFEFQPTLRGLWTPDTDTSYWAAITRAVRTPDRVNTDGELNLGGPTAPIGNPDQESFINYTYELGHRKNIRDKWIFDSTLFYSDYRNTVQNFVTTAIDTVYGFEGYLKYQHNSSLRLEAGYTYHKGEMENVGSGNVPLTRLPRHTVKIRSYYDLRKNIDLDLFIQYVDESESQTGATTVSDYTRFDLHLGWRPARSWSVNLLLSNMLDDVHAEAIDALKVNTGVRRGAMLKLTYKPGS